MRGMTTASTLGAEALPTAASAGAAFAGRVFATTHWSVVLAAGGTDTTQAQAALEVLCRHYWHPLYHYLRRCGHPAPDAQDLTQGFFHKFIERQAVAKAAPDRGRFRSFLLASLKHYVADCRDKERAAKRGGPAPRLPLDFAREETRLATLAAGDLTPEESYERRWAITLLEQVYGCLAAEFQMQGKGAQFEALRVALAGDRGAVPYAVIAERTGMTEGAVKVAVHRLRQRYRALLRETVANTVSSPGEIDDELRHLLRVLAR